MVKNCYKGKHQILYFVQTCMATYDPFPPQNKSSQNSDVFQTCLNSPDPPSLPNSSADQRMSATGYEETELTYNVNEDEQSKVSFVPLDSGIYGWDNGSKMHSFRCLGSWVLETTQLFLFWLIFKL